MSPWTFARLFVEGTPYSVSSSEHLASPCWNSLLPFTLIMKQAPSNSENPFGHVEPTTSIKTWSTTVGLFLFECCAIIRLDIVNERHRNANKTFLQGNVVRNYFCMEGGTHAIWMELKIWAFRIFLSHFSDRLFTDRYLWFQRTDIPVIKDSRTWWNGIC